MRHAGDCHAGGGVDDFCPDGVAYGSRRVRTAADLSSALQASTFEPDFDALVDAMVDVATGRRLKEGRFIETRRRPPETFSWWRSAQAL